jgi:hypothetical protein
MEYDPVLNSWIFKNIFPGNGRNYSVSFTIGNNAYIGTGYNSSSLNDFWKYNSNSNSWIQLVNFPIAREDAAAFSIGSKGYVAAGVDGLYYNDLWEYDSTNNSWTQKANIGTAGRWDCVGFSINGKGYIGEGLTLPITQKEFWEYDPSSNNWNQLENFCGQPYYGMFGFVIGNKGYIGSGSNGSGKTKQFWELNPSVGTNYNSNVDLKCKINIYPNPSNKYFNISFQSSSKQTVELRIFNTLGEEVYFSKEENATGKFSKEINVERLHNGIYFVKFKAKERVFNTKIIVQH